MDGEILEQLYREHYSSAMLYCLTLCADAQLAQDLVADAFVKAYLSLPEEIPSFRFWLLRVCRNLWIDQQRKRKFLAGSAPLSRLTSGISPEQAYLTRERSRVLWQAVQKLGDADRELITLHYFSGMPLHQAAALLGIRYDAARQRIVRLRRKLKQELEEQGYGY